MQVNERMVNISAKGSVFFGLHLQKNAIERLENISEMYKKSIKYLQTSFLENDEGDFDYRDKENDLLNEDKLRLHSDILSELKNISGSIENHIVTSSDVLLSSKSSNFIASTIDLKNKITSDIFICSTMYLIIRIHNIDELKPEFLKYILNTKKYQNILQQRASGMGLQKVLTKKIIQSIQIPLPSIEVQEKAIHIFKERAKSRKLVYDIEDLIDMKLEAQLFQRF